LENLLAKFGSFLKIKRHGEGIFRDFDGTTYIGQWVSDEKEMKGTLTLPSGAQYKGLFLGGQVFNSSSLKLRISKFQMSN
jgi:hypothetical protein